VNFLVVGGAGYIGSVVVGEVVRSRRSAIVLDDLSTGHKDAVAPLAYLIEGGGQTIPRTPRGVHHERDRLRDPPRARSIVVNRWMIEDTGARTSISICLLDAMQEHRVKVQLTAGGRASGSIDRGEDHRKETHLIRF
jgi:nucleoside-diphosphate-sugar epimerase